MSTTTMYVHTTYHVTTIHYASLVSSSKSASVISMSVASKRSFSTVVVAAGREDLLFSHRGNMYTCIYVEKACV